MSRSKQGTGWILLMVAAFAGACVPNGLDLKLLKALTTDLSKNQAIAPFVMSSLMTQVWLGARGDTRDEVQRQPDASFLTSYQSAISDLTDGSSNVTTGVFNRIYIKHGFSIKSGFKDLLQNHYFAGVKKFSSAAQAAKEINSDVATVTRDRIKKLVSPSTLQNAVMVLVSALYFKGLWLTPFDMTVKGPFLTASGNKQVDMMKLRTRVPYVKMPHFDAISLPYTDKNYVMLILRPLTRNMAAVSRLRDSLDSLDVSDIMKRLRASSVQISMPRFKIRTEYGLAGTMSQLGIRKIFTSRADLGNIADEPLAVDGIIHKVFMEVTENGTEAAGAAAITFVITSVQPLPIQFTADRPIFVIVWNKKHMINLFSAYIGSPNVNG
ncbi:ovalbumin-related protein X-like [Pollicipes pollicipes]|uniref:ovalbumin-related protein X-like n=1 Tax=Pollicipes pollicipes TaxID=41117 RepID=UPI0018852DFF|nr:ovalbumin-related protein X-like [Pollicipes pollicipes]